MPDDHLTMLRIGVAQPMAVPGDVNENIRRMEPLIEEAARRGAGLVVFSECALNGYDLRGVGLGTAVSFDDPKLEKLDALARRFETVLVVGFFEREGASLYNSAAAFHPNGRRDLQRKHAMGGFELQVKTIAPGPRERRLFEVQGLKCAILICADNGIPGIQAELAKNGCDLIIAPTAGLGDAKHAFRQHELSDPVRREEYIRRSDTVCSLSQAAARNLELNVGLACCNQMGFDEASGFFHCGHSGVIDRTGETTALIPGRFCADHLRPDVAVGFVTRRSSTPGGQG